MKQIIRKKLHVNGETLRALAAQQLTHAVGGRDTGRAECDAPANSGAFECLTQAAVVKAGG